MKRAANPHEVLLVADALTGQDAVNLARSFDERVGLTGIVLTRVDGDGRGGAALSMRAVTGKPIKLLGTGERMDALEDFDPARIAGRILGMGDIVSLVEKAAAEHRRREGRARRREDAQGRVRSRRPARSARADGEDGRHGRPDGHDARHGQDQERSSPTPTSTRSCSSRQKAIIDSMTPRERRNPDLLKASRKKRIAAGSGTRVEDINRLLKMHRGMADMMKAMGGGKRGPLAALGNMMGFGGGGMPSPEEMAKLAEKMPGGLPGGMPADCRRASPAAPEDCRRRCPACRRNFRACPALAAASCPADSPVSQEWERRNDAAQQLSSSS